MPLPLSSVLSRAYVVRQVDVRRVCVDATEILVCYSFVGSGVHALREEYISAEQ